MQTSRYTYKFGGSSLREHIDYTRAARFLVEDSENADGPICVVVSARYGDTDRIIEEALEIFSNPWMQIDYVAREGEFYSARRLAQALNEVTLDSAHILTPWEIELTTQGENPFNNELVGIQNNKPLFDTAKRFLVIPGYVGVNKEVELDGGPALAALGRGASDLIAVEVAKNTHSTLKLIKSAKSIYAVSPKFVERPKPITHMTPDQALRVLEYIRSDEQFIMAKAVKRAQKYNVPLEFRSIEDTEAFSRIDSVFRPDEPTLFRALPVKENVSRLHIMTRPEKLSRLYEELHKRGIPFNDGGSEAINGEVRTHLFAETPVAGQIKRTIEESLSEYVNLTKGSLITLIDTLLDSEGNHFMRVTRALSDVNVLYTASSGIIMHVFVSPKDTKKAVRALAYEFELIEL